MNKNDVCKIITRFSLTCIHTVSLRVARASSENLCPELRVSERHCAFLVTHALPCVSWRITWVLRGITPTFYVALCRNLT